MCSECTQVQPVLPDMYLMSSNNDHAYNFTFLVIYIYISSKLVFSFVYNCLKPRTVVFLLPYNESFYLSRVSTVALNKQTTPWFLRGSFALFILYVFSSRIGGGVR